MKATIVLSMVGLAIGQLAVPGTLLADPSPSVTQRYLQCVAASDLDCAVALFHFPAAYTREELEDDRRGVNQALGLFSREFGAPRNAKLAQPPAQYIVVSFGGGTLPYWQQHPESRLFSFDVTFAHDGQGLVTVQTCTVAGREQIRDVSYGLPASGPSSAARIKSVADKLQGLLQSPRPNNTRDDRAEQGLPPGVRG